MISEFTISKKFIIFFFITAISLFSSGCSSLMSRATSELGNNLSHAMLNSNDIDTVSEATPAYLLLMDSLVNSYDNEEKADKKRDVNLLISASTLYSSYAEIAGETRERKKKLSEKAFDYASRAVCAGNRSYCGMKGMDFQMFEQTIAQMKKNEIPAFFALGSSWASWISARSDDFNAIAEISRIELIMYRITELDETYNNGRAHLYLGTLATLLPPALGGKPDVGKSHFEKAISISEGRDLMAKVTFAKQYAKMMFERELHDKLLNEVISANPEMGGLTLSNTLAQKQAEIMLKEADEYF